MQKSKSLIYPRNNQESEDEEIEEDPLIDTKNDFAKQYKEIKHQQLKKQKENHKMNNEKGDVEIGEENEAQLIE